MSGEKPLKLYIVITIGLIVIVTVLGLVIRNFVAEKFPAQPEAKINKTAKGSDPEEVRLSKSILKFAGIIFLILMIIFVAFKLAMKKIKG